MEEIWKPIKGYENLYEISNFGRIRRYLVPDTNKKGYQHLFLVKDNKRVDKSIHRLVAEHFIPNPDNLPVVNHKDENPANNNVSNLEWCSHQYNLTYGTAIQRKVAKLSIPVAQYDLEDNLIQIWSSLSEAGRNGYNIGHIYECCRGLRKSHNGCHWSYFNSDQIDN